MGLIDGITGTLFSSATNAIIFAFLPLIVYLYHRLMTRLFPVKKPILSWVVIAAPALLAALFLVFSFFHLVTCLMCLPFTLLTLIPTFIAIAMWLISRKSTEGKTEERNNAVSSFGDSGSDNCDDAIDDFDDSGSDCSEDNDFSIDGDYSCDVVDDDITLPSTIQKHVSKKQIPPAVLARLIIALSLVGLSGWLVYSYLLNPVVVYDYNDGPIRTWEAQRMGDRFYDRYAAMGPPWELNDPSLLPYADISRTDEPTPEQREKILAEVDMVIDGTHPNFTKDVHPDYLDEDPAFFLGFDPRELVGVEPLITVFNHTVYATYVLVEGQKAFVLHIGSNGNGSVEWGSWY